ncbi:MAG: hypothetical protein D6719_07475, partial [Candidatus Dadabacteria bacterium]
MQFLSFRLKESGEDGVFIVIVAFIIVTILGFVAYSVDLGKFMQVKSALQMQTDIATMEALYDLRAGGKLEDAVANVKNSIKSQQQLSGADQQTLQRVLNSLSVNAYV